MTRSAIVESYCPYCQWRMTMLVPTPQPWAGPWDRYDQHDPLADITGAVIDWKKSCHTKHLGDTKYRGVNRDLRSFLAHLSRLSRQR